MFVTTAIVVILVPALFFAIPLPPPKIHLGMTPKWFLEGTNAVVTMVFTNSGQTITTVGEDAWHVAIETPNGWTTNGTAYPGNNHGVIIEPQGKTLIPVPVPTNCIRWRVTVDYCYYRRHGSHYEVWSAINRAGFWDSAPRWLHDAVWKSMDGVVRYTTADGKGAATTDFFTNLPPVQSMPPN